MKKPEKGRTPMGKWPPPGKDRGFLETEQYAQGVRCRLPKLTVTGRRKGPTLVVIAAQHGRELNGIAAIEQVFMAVSPDALRGRIVFLPIMNPLGVRMRRQDFPLEESRYRPSGIVQNFNLNRSWPMEKVGGNTAYVETVAACVCQRVLQQADALIDFHGWTGLSVPLVMGRETHRAWSRAFGLPWYLLHDRHAKGTPGTTASVARKLGLPQLTVELTPQNLVSPQSVQWGATGILNVLRHMSMLPGRIVLPAEQFELRDRRRKTIFRAAHEGLVVPEKTIGTWIEAGERVARLLSLETLETIQEFRAEFAGLLYHVGGCGGGEDTVESAILYPGQFVGCVEEATRVNHARLTGARHG